MKCLPVAPKRTCFFCGYGPDGEPFANNWRLEAHMLSEACREEIEKIWKSEEPAMVKDRIRLFLPTKRNLVLLRDARHYHMINPSMQRANLAFIPTLQQINDTRLENELEPLEEYDLNFGAEVLEEEMLAEKKRLEMAEQERCVYVERMKNLSLSSSPKRKGKARRRGEEISTSSSEEDNGGFAESRYVDDNDFEPIDPHVSQSNQPCSSRLATQTDRCTQTLEQEELMQLQRSVQVSVRRLSLLELIESSGRGAGSVISVLRRLDDQEPGSKMGLSKVTKRRQPHRRARESAINYDDCEESSFICSSLSEGRVVSESRTNVFQKLDSVPYADSSDPDFVLEINANQLEAVMWDRFTKVKPIIHIRDGYNVDGFASQLGSDVTQEESFRKALNILFKSEVLRDQTFSIRQQATVSIFHILNF